MHVMHGLLDTPDSRFLDIAKACFFWFGVGRGPMTMSTFRLVTLVSQLLQQLQLSGIGT